jgi:hypothetical protein
VEVQLDRRVVILFSQLSPQLVVLVVSPFKQTVSVVVRVRVEAATMLQRLVVLELRLKVLMVEATEAATHEPLAVAVVQAATEVLVVLA